MNLGRGRFTCWCVLMCLVVSLKSLASDIDHARILVVKSYDPNFPTYADISYGLNEVLDRDSVLLDVSYMHSKLVYDVVSVANYKRAISYQFLNSQKYDMVITVDDNALRFALSERQGLFRDLPIVFLGVNNVELALSLKGDKQVSGVIEAVSFDENIQFIQEAMPHVENIHLLVDGTTTGRADFEKLSRTIADYPDFNWKKLDLATLAWGELIEDMASIDAHNSVVLLISAYRDKNNVALSFDESVYLITDATTAPIVHPYQHGIGQGLLGGLVVDHRAHAVLAGELAHRYFHRGYFIEEDMVVQPPTKALFDYAQLKRFGIKERDLPSGSHILGKPEPILSRYYVEVMTLFGLVFIILTTLALLAWVKKRTAEQDEDKLKSILNSLDSYIYLKDEHGRYLFANKKMCQNLSLDEDEVLGKDDYDLFDENVATRISSVDQLVVNSKKPYSSEETYWHEDVGKKMIVHTRKVPLMNDKGDIYAICGSSIDITRSKTQERIIEQIAYQDPTNGLGNRVKLFTYLTDVMSKSEFVGGQTAVGFFDIDNFRYINETYGHTAGDHCIDIVLDKLKRLVGEAGQALRLGGDEFYLVVYGETHASQTIRDIQRQLPETVNILGNTIPLSVSVGISLYPAEGVTEPEQLLRRAELSSYEAKMRGGNQAVCLDNSQDQKASDNEFITEVIGAMHRNELELYFQPKASSKQKTIVGAEALIRWNHPVKGFLTPNMFLPEVHRLGLFKQIDDWVIERAMETLDAWCEAGLALNLSINLSHEYFSQTDLFEILQDKLARYPNIKQGLLEIEILETHALEDLNHVSNMIKKCRLLGIRFSIDDFGTGYSSLTYLQRLPVDTLKVDQSFVRHGLREVDIGILKGILVFCNALHITPIVEGVETVQELKRLNEVGFDYIQGYLISKPVTENAFIARVKAQPANLSSA